MDVPLFVAIPVATTKCCVVEVPSGALFSVKITGSGVLEVMIGSMYGRIALSVVPYPVPELGSNVITPPWDELA